MSDLDGDSQMHSSGSASDAEESEGDIAADERGNLTSNRSSSFSAQATAATVKTSSNVNGKRPFSGDSSSGLPGMEQSTANDQSNYTANSTASMLSSSNTQTANQGSSMRSKVYDQPAVHQASGYTWDRDEDAPGFLWLNRKAQEEAAKAWDQIQNKENVIGTKYGDLLTGEE